MRRISIDDKQNIISLLVECFLKLDQTDKSFRLDQQIILFIRWYTR